MALFWGLGRTARLTGARLWARPWAAALATVADLRRLEYVLVDVVLAREYRLAAAARVLGLGGDALVGTGPRVVGRRVAVLVAYVLVAPEKPERTVRARGAE